MAVASLKVKQPVETLTIGATAGQGGTRSGSLIIGGETTMPFLGGLSRNPRPPLVAMEFWDVKPQGWSGFLEESLGHVWADPVSWGEFLEQETDAPILCLRLMGAHPGYGQSDPREIEKTVKRILQRIKKPLIILGCGVGEIDNEIIPAAARASAGERLLLGNATAENYKTITSACLEFGHNIITESPIDINIAKQANILVQDMGMAPDRIVMYATTGALGYGLEYAYSIMEKTRLSGLEGDRFMNKPQIALVGQEVWRVKEANKNMNIGINWEVVTGAAYLLAGADILAVYHPESGKKLKELIGTSLEND